MCCHFGITFWNLSGQFFEYQTNGNKCYTRIPTSLRFSKINQAETAAIEPTYHLHLMLHILFYQVHLQRSTSDSSFAQSASPAHVRALLPLPPSSHPAGGCTVQINAVHQQPSGHTNASHFHSGFLCWGFLRAGWLFGFRKETTPWLRNNGTSCVIPASPRSPDILLCSNARLLFYFSDHGCPLQLAESVLAQEHWGDQHGRASCQKGRQDRKREENRNALIATRI